MNPFDLSGPQFLVFYIGIALIVVIAMKLAIDMGEGTIYPLMRRMQSDGLVETYLVESSSGPPRKYYRLTNPGRRRVREMAHSWRAFAQGLERLLAPMEGDPS